MIVYISKDVLSWVLSWICTTTKRRIKIADISKTKPTWWKLSMGNGLTISKKHLLLQALQKTMPLATSVLFVAEPRSAKSLIATVEQKCEVTRMTNNSGYFINPKEKPPCTKDCPERSQKCHSECKKYIEWKNNYDIRKKSKIDFDMKFNVVDSYKIERTKQKKER